MLCPEGESGTPAFWVKEGQLGPGVGNTFWVKGGLLGHHVGDTFWTNRGAKRDVENTPKCAPLKYILAPRSCPLGLAAFNKTLIAEG